MTQPMVFIVHRTTVRSSTGGRMDKFDLSPAKRFGTLIDILMDDEANQSPENIICRLTNTLIDFTDKDSLLCTGDPMVLMIAGMVLERHCKKWMRLRILKWDKHKRDYTPYFIDRIPLSWP